MRNLILRIIRGLLICLWIGIFYGCSTRLEVIAMGLPLKSLRDIVHPKKNRAIYKNLGIPEVKSSHLYGRAADILATTSRDRFNIVNALIKAGFNRIGISEKSGFIHVDNDCQEYGGQKSSNVIWIY